MLENQTNSVRTTQVILTTHSPTLASSADPERLIMLNDGEPFPMGASYTKLSSDDYKYLQRFLDATKANLFFARGLLIVEGDAEVLLLPALAEKLGLSLAKYGVSIVNVGSTGLFRYARIFQRQPQNGVVTEIDIPVACIATGIYRPLKQSHP